MSDDLPLFENDEPGQAQPVTVREAPIAEWQIELIRKALDGRALASMADRQHLIQSVVGHEVETLRTLTHAEAIRVLTTLGASPRTTQATGSRWDQRDEETWLDRL